MIILGSRLSLCLCVILFACSSESQKADVGDEPVYSSVSLNEFKLNSIRMVTSKDTLIKSWGMPLKETMHFFSNDTLKTIFYVFGESECSFVQKKHSIVFSYCFFNDDFVIKNSYAEFSHNTKLGPMALLFPESFKGIATIDDKKILFLETDRRGAGLRLEFIDDKLTAMHFGINEKGK